MKVFIFVSLVLLEVISGDADIVVSVSNRFGRAISCCSDLENVCASRCVGQKCEIKCGGKCGPSNTQCGPYTCSTLTNQCSTSIVPAPAVPTSCCSDVQTSCASRCVGQKCAIKCGGKCGPSNTQCGPYTCGSVTKQCSTASGFVEVNSDDFITLSAAEKNEIIWSNTIKDTSSAPWFTQSEIFGIFTEDICPTMRAKGDEMPLGDNGIRKKFIHTVGTVAQIEWQNLRGHSYTGLFAENSIGYVRLSLARQPDPSGLNTSPGLGLKLLRDGIESASLVAMFSVDGQESWNFFANDFTNHIGAAGPALVPLENKFATATKYVTEVGLSDFASYNQGGNKVLDPNFPFMLRFHPTGDIMFSDKYVQPFTEDLKSIPKGSTLYEIWALDQPLELGGKEKHIGNLVMTSEMVTSLWGDQHLFFRHQDMADDVDIHPEWEKYLLQTGTTTNGCPMKTNV